MRVEGVGGLGKTAEKFTICVIMTLHGKETESEIQNVSLIIIIIIIVRESHAFSTPIL